MEEPTPQQHTGRSSQNNSGWGATIGIIIIVALFALGGFYFFLQDRPAPQPAAVGAMHA